jgi:hypothetical protein
MAATLQWEMSAKRLIHYLRTMGQFTMLLIVNKETETTQPAFCKN